MITEVETAALYAGVVDVATNTAAKATTVAAGAPTMTAAAPAGADEASALASLNTTAHTANFIAVALTGALTEGMYAGALGMVGFNYDAIDFANATAV